MKNINVLITGITGQDGIFLTNELLNNKNVNIYGTSRKYNKHLFVSKLNYLNKNIDFDRINIINSNLLLEEEVFGILNKIKPDYIYHMSGPSSVYDSLTNTELSKQIILIFDNLITSCIKLNIFPNFFQSSSSEMFGKNTKTMLDEKSEFIPNSPYGDSKALIHHKISSIRKEYKWSLASGIMFNHESEFRQDDYLFMKIINYAMDINKQNSQLTLGSLELKRDWSYAKDIANAAVLINQSNCNSDYVLGSGKSKQIKYVANKIFQYFDLDYKDYVKVNENLLRSGDPLERISNPNKIKKDLNWEAKTSISEIINKIIKYKLSIRN